MPPASLVDSLKKAAENLSRPFATADDVRSVSIVLDAIAGTLARSAAALAKLGPQRVADSSVSGPELPTVLRQIGGQDFERAAAYASELLAVCGSSLVDFGSAGQFVSTANAARERLHEAIADLVAKNEREG
jgi:hypothetical protein